MRAFGGLMLFVAVCMAWNASNSVQSAGNANVVDEIVGNKKRSEDSAVSFGIGAALFGIVGIVLIASGGSRPEVSPPPAVVVREVPPQNPPSDSIAQRLTSLKGLHDGGLITDDEYQSRRQRLLDEA